MFDCMVILGTPYLIIERDHKMDGLPNKTLLDKCRQKNPWDFGNKVLYDLCACNFKHDSDDKIIAKVWLLGRAYSVAVERRKTKNVLTTISTLTQLHRHLGNQNLTRIF